MNLFLNDTACNLASLNLLKFKNPDGTFNVDRFQAACRIFITAQEILVDNSSYPTKWIAENSHIFRPLGLGYANLGALLMSMGLPYDSDAGREMCASITALMTGTAYHQSAVLAEAMGPFAGYHDARCAGVPEPVAPSNEESMLKVIGMHCDAAFELHDHIAGSSAAFAIIEAATTAWDQALELGKSVIVDAALTTALGPRESYLDRETEVTVLVPPGGVVESTLTTTNRGLLRLKSLGCPDGPRRQRVDLNVSTDEGPRRAASFYVNPLRTTVAMESKRGYCVRAAPTHLLKVVNPLGKRLWEWKRLADLQVGDMLPLQLGGMLGAPIAVPLPSGPALYRTAARIDLPTTVTKEFAEFVGWFMANGSQHIKGLRITIDNHDDDVVEVIREAGLRLFGLKAHVAAAQGCHSVEFNSTPFSRWWTACGLAKLKPHEGHVGKGYNVFVPDLILATNDREIYAAFIRGVTELDGSVDGGVPTLSNKSRQFVNDLRSMLLVLGMPFNIKTDIGGKSGKPVYKIRLASVSFCKHWLATVGFAGCRKRRKVQVNHPQSGKNDLIPVPRELIERLLRIGNDDRHTAFVALTRSGGISRDFAKRLLLKTGDRELDHLLGYFYDTVKSLVRAPEQATFDLAVSGNGTYTANGFLGRSTIGLVIKGEAQ